MIDYEEMYKNSELSKILNMLEYGIKELEKAVKFFKRNLISKKEYNDIRKTIEKQLFKI